MPSRLSASRDKPTIRPFAPADEPGVLGLLQTAFGRWPTGLEVTDPAEFFRWKHLKGPFGKSALFVAETDGAIIGFCAALPWRLGLAARTVRAVRGVDLAVDPVHRRRGVSVALREEMERHYPLDDRLLFANPNSQSRPGSLKAGRQVVGEFARFVRVRRPLRVIAGPVRARWGEPARAPSVRAETAADALSDIRSVGRLLDEIDERSHRLRTVKDVEYLRWRYGSIGDYLAVRTYRGDRLTGIAIFSVRQVRGRWGASVCELLSRDDVRTERELLRKLGRAVDLDYLVCRFTSRREAALRGFLHVSGRDLLVGYALREDLVPHLTRPSSWLLSQGDWELL